VQLIRSISGNTRAGALCSPIGTRLQTNCVLVYADQAWNLAAGAGLGIRRLILRETNLLWPAPSDS
jgi:hypothetical protein